MEKKINLFTALIFVYSLVVCGVFKRPQETSSPIGQHRVTPSAQWTSVKQAPAIQTLTASSDIRPVSRNN
jgi:hypothetical protein